MDKIILTKRQAVALEKALENNFTKEIVLKTHVSVHLKDDGKWKGDNYQYLNQLSIEQMAIALYVGYELEKTKEEIILETYEYCNGFNDEKLRNFYKRGIYDLLNILDMKVKGINE